jgi:hypothetical protein
MEASLPLSELTTGGSVLSTDSTNGSFCRETCHNIRFNILENEKGKTNQEI